MIRKWINSYMKLLMKDTMKLIDEDEQLLYYVCNKCGSINVYTK